MAKSHLTEEDLTAGLLTASEVGLLLRVDPKTVTRWAVAGKIPCIRTIGGHRRYRRADIEPYLNPTSEENTTP